MPYTVVLTSLRRVAAFVAALALLVVAVPAAAAERSATGGAVAQPAKKVSTKRVQRALGIRADGIFGPQTRRTLKSFQRANGLKATGRADTATLRALGLLGKPRESRLDAVPAATGTPAILEKIAQCESGGNPTIVSANGRYFGKYQFSLATWESLGGTGNPAEADEATQDAMARKLYELRGTAPWPSCGS